VGGTDRRVVIYIWLWAKERNYLKNKLNQNGLLDVTQVVELLPSNHNALSSNPNAPKRQKNPKNPKFN
jgi:hypothetical protein